MVGVARLASRWRRPEAPDVRRASRPEEADVLAPCPLGLPPTLHAPCGGHATRGDPDTAVRHSSRPPPQRPARGDRITPMDRAPRRRGTAYRPDRHRGNPPTPVTDKLALITTAAASDLSRAMPLGGPRSRDGSTEQVVPALAVSPTRGARASGWRTGSWCTWRPPTEIPEWSGASPLTTNDTLAVCADAPGSPAFVGPWSRRDTLRLARHRPRCGLSQTPDF